MFGWWVVGVGDGLVDWVVVALDGFALAADGEVLVGGADGRGDERTDGQGVGDGPVGVGEADGVVLVDVAEERDPSCGEWDVEVAFGVEVVGDADGWGPAELVPVGVDVFGWVAGAAGGGVEDGSAGVEPLDGTVRAGFESVEVVVAFSPDGFALPFVVDGFDVVGPSNDAGWRDEDLDTEVEADPDPVGEGVVGVCR